MGSISSSLSVASLSTSAVSRLINSVAFSTAVHGKTYNANVTYSNGEYVANDANLIGAEATGSSVQAAEENLSTIIEIIA